MCKCLLPLLFGFLFSTLCDGHVLSYGNCRGCLRFPSNGTTISHVERILIDTTNKRLIAGARNSLFRIDLNSLKLPSANSDFVALLPSPGAVKDCFKNGGFTRSDCENNYIKILLFDTDGRIFACGTCATKRRCWRFQRTSALSPLPPDGIDGNGITPFSYKQNVTGTFTSDHLFTGINSDIGTRGSIIYRTEAAANSNELMTGFYSEKVLKDANFVSSFGYNDNFVYFFLRESAVERGKRIIYSRVARVCQYDEGAAKYALKGKFTSFVKTRIICSVPGEIPFDYDQIQAAVKSTDPKTNEDYVYGIFTTPELGVAGSAVCRYSMKSVVELFDKSEYLEEDTSIKSYDGNSLWRAVNPVNLTQVPGRPKCDRSLDTKSYSFGTNQFAIDHTLLADPLTPKPAKPLITRADTRFTGIVVDQAKGVGGAVVPVMFISLDNGTVFKVFNNISGDHNPIIVEQINIFEKPDPIYTMKLYQGAVFIGSSSSIVKLPVEHCSQYQTCRTCISSLDPYCGWSKNKCTTFQNKEGSTWTQDISHANFSKVCPEELPTCSLLVTQEQVGGTTILTCQGERGIPLPKVTKWTKENKAVTVGADYQFKPGKTSDQEILAIRNFGINHLGVYECVVANKLGSSSCAMNVRGALPVIMSRLVKINHTSLFVCNATGLPTPRVTIHKVIGGVKHVINSHQVPISADSGQRSYYCVAQNEFGSSFGKTVKIYDKQVKAELRLTDEGWSSELSDEKSDKYKALADKVRTAVREAYAKNPSFVGFKEISFSKGSVICKMTLSFAADPLNTNAELLEDLQAEVSTGKVGQFTVDTSHVLNVEPKVEPTPAPDRQDSVDNGLFAVAVVTAILLSLILGFALGVKFHRQVFSHCKRSSGDAESCDGKNKTVEGVKYTKSPPRDKYETQSKKNLLKKKRVGTGETEDDSDSDNSTAGKIGQEEEKHTPSSGSPAKSISPSVSITRFEKKKPSLKNGKIGDAC